MNKVIDMNAVGKKLRSCTRDSELQFPDFRRRELRTSGRQRGRKDHADKADPGAAEGAVFLSITGLILRIMANHVEQMEV